MIKTPLSTVIGGAFWTPGATVINGAKLSFETVMKKLFANGEQGFWYDPYDLTTEKVNWRRNLLTETEFRNGTSDAPSRGGDISAASFTGVSNKQTGLLISNASNTLDAYAYKSFSEWKVDVPYTLSVFLRMQDGSAPVIGASGVDNRADIGLVIKGGYARDFELHDLGGGLYRASATVTNSTITGGAGVVKYKAFTARPVLVTGYQLEEGTKATAYQGFTNFNTEFMARFPDHNLFQDILARVPISAVNQPAGLIKDKSGRNNHALQSTSSARPILQDAPRRIDFDAVDDKLITNLPAQLTGCTVIRAVPGVGVQLLTNQTIPATYEDNKDHCGLIVINRALTPSETSTIAAEFNKRAGV